MKNREVKVVVKQKSTNWNV